MGFLDLAYHFPGFWVVLGRYGSISVALRFLLYFMEVWFNLGRNKIKLVIVGSRGGKRAGTAVASYSAGAGKLYCTVAPRAEADTRIYLSRLPAIRRVVQIYKIEKK